MPLFAELGDSIFLILDTNTLYILRMVAGSENAVVIGPAMFERL
jgi:hypothetical protein